MLLYANVAVVCSDLVCAYNVNLEVQPPVHPVLHPEAGPLLATTWNTGTTGLTGSSPWPVGIASPGQRA